MKSITIALSAALAIVCIMLANLYLTVNDVSKDKQPIKSPKYHIQVITQNSDDHFWKMFKDGANSAGVNLNVYVEFVDISKRDVDNSIQAVERGIYADVDGIALQANDIEKTTAILKEASDNGLSVLTYENDLYNIPDVVSVGSNSYDIGFTAGTMGVKACNGVGNVAVIINDSSDKDNQYKNIKVQGIMEAFSKYSNMNISQVYTLDTGVFEMEKLTSKILTNNPNVNLIICTDERNTPGVAQVLVDSNRVGDIKVIGYGEMPQTISYIERGVIYGTVCPDAYQIGYNTVSQLNSILEGETVSDSTNTDVYSVDEDNYKLYIENTKE